VFRPSLRSRPLCITDVHDGCSAVYAGVSAAVTSHVEQWLLPCRGGDTPLLPGYHGDLGAAPSTLSRATMLPRMHAAVGMNENCSIEGTCSADYFRFHLPLLPGITIRSGGGISIASRRQHRWPAWADCALAGVVDDASTRT
jgi:hypothetical protein